MLPFGPNRHTATLDTAVSSWRVGDIIPLGRDRILRIIDARQEPVEHPVLVVETVPATSDC